MKKGVFHNAGLKISAVLLSVLLWFFVTLRGQSEISLDVPLEFASVPAGLGIEASSVKNVTVTIRGQERVIKSVKPMDIRVSVDLGKAKRGDGTYNINKDDIRLPYAMTVTNVSPSSVRVRLEETVSRAVMVKPVIIGSPEKGFEIRSVDVEPRSVRAQGLRTDVRRLGDIRTEPLDIGGFRETVSQELGLDMAGVGIKADPASVKVTVVIGRKG